MTATARMFVVGCCVTFLASDRPAAAQSPPDVGRFAASATFGVSRANESSMREMYGTTLTPITGQIDVRVYPDLALFAGVRWLKADGQTVIVGTPVTADEKYAISLSTTSFRFGAQVSKWVAPRWGLAAGAGVCITSYDEQWPDAGLGVSGRSTGFLALAELRYALASRWNVIGRVDFTTVPESTTAAGSVNLGGLDVSAGMRVLF